MSLFNILWLLLSHADITFPDASSYHYFQGALDSLFELGYLDAQEHDCIREKILESALSFK